MTLVGSSDIFGLDIFDAPFVHFAGGDEAGLDEFPQAGGHFRIEFVIVGGHPITSSHKAAIARHGERGERRAV